MVFRTLSVKKKKAMGIWLFSLIVGCMSAQDNIKLPEPVMQGGMPLMEALKNRQTIRQIAAKKLDPQQLSNLLWAANGVNRPENGKRTSPTARNMMQIKIYVVLEEGIFFFDPDIHELVLHKKGNHRSIVGRQPFTHNAPVGLIFVADFDKMPDMTKEQQEFYAATDTGNISQNIYLFAASEKLATVVLGSIDREEIQKTLDLPFNHKVVLSQVIGFPEQ